MANDLDTEGKGDGNSSSGPLEGVREGSGEIEIVADGLQAGDKEDAVLRSVGKTSTSFAAYNVICCVVGFGLLGLPYGLAESGWVGAVMLIAIGCVGVYTASILVRCMSPPSGRHLYSYGEIGREAFGPKGEAFVTLVLHVALLGIATLFLILAGGNLVSLLDSVPWPSAEQYRVSLLAISQQQAIVAVALVMWLHVWLKTMHEVGFMR